MATTRTAVKLTRPKDDVGALRKGLVQKIGALDATGAKDFARFVREGDDSRAIPCWGGLVERFDETFPADEDRIAVWDVLVEHPDRRALLLFIDLNRARTPVLERIFEDVASLPADVQRALVSMPEVQPLVPAHAAALAPGARQLWKRGPQAIRKEARLTDARIAGLKRLRRAPTQVPPIPDVENVRFVGRAVRLGPGANEDVVPDDDPRPSPAGGTTRGATTARKKKS